MAIRSLENLKTESLGESNVLLCPCCGKATALQIFLNSDRSAVSLLKKKRDTGFAVCPKCAAVFSVNENYIEQKHIGTVCQLEGQDLTVLVKGRD